MPSDDKTIQELIRVLKTGNYDEQIEVARTLGGYQSEEAAKALMQIIETSEGDLWIEAYEALIEMAHPISLPVFLKPLEKLSQNGRIVIYNYEEFDIRDIEVLGRIGDPRAIPSLLKILHHTGKYFKRGELAKQRVLLQTQEALLEIKNHIQETNPKQATQIEKEARTIGLSMESSSGYMSPTYYDDIEFSVISEVVNLSPDYIYIEGEGGHYLWSIGQLDLDGIEQCQNLRTLILHGNPLGLIDLTPLAACSKLEVLDLSNCSLVSLDLTPLQSLPELHTINLDKNEIYCIDISPLFNCPNLTTVIGYGAKIYAHPIRKDQRTLPPALERIKDDIIWGDFNDDCYDPI